MILPALPPGSKYDSSNCFPELPCSIMERRLDRCLCVASASAVGESNMSRSVVVRLLLICSLLAAVVTGCSRDPNVRKQKYFDSGEKYFAEGKYREAALQYSNAIQIDSRYAQAH